MLPSKYTIRKILLCDRTAPSAVSTELQCLSTSSEKSYKMASQVDRELIVAVGSESSGENLEEIRSLLQNGASGDFVFEDDPSIPGEHEGYNALMVAARCGRHDVVELMLEFGADPGVTGEDFYPQMGPIHCATKSGQPKCLVLLLDANRKDGRPVDPNGAEAEGGNTALHFAVGAAQVWIDRLGDFEKCVTILASHPTIDLDYQNMKGDTPLHLAVRAGNPAVITTLLEAGARADIPNNAGQIAAYRLLEKLPHLLTKAFDASIRLNNAGLDDDKLEMDLDFGILVAQQKCALESASKDGVKGGGSGHWCEGESRETQFIESVADSKSFELLCHPLLQAFLDIKWHVSRRWHQGYTFTYALVSLLFVVWLIALIASKESFLTAGFSRFAITAAFGVPLIIKVISRLILNRHSLLATVTEFEFFLEVAIAVCQVSLALEHSRNATLNVAAVGFILVFFRIACLFSHLPNVSLGLHLSVMLQVGKKMAVLVPIFLVVFIAFGLSFVVLFSEEEAELQDGATTEQLEPSNHTSGLLNVEAIFKWVMQTLVMSTGEMNYTDLKFTVWVARVVFVVFVFVGHLLLMNALIGFAVNDTTELHRLAAAHCARKRAAAVANVEKALIWTAQEMADVESGPTSWMRRTCRILGSFFQPVFVRPQLASLGGVPSSGTKLANGKEDPMTVSMQVQKCVLTCHPNSRATDRGLARALAKDVVKEAVAIAHEARSNKAHRAKDE